MRTVTNGAACSLDMFITAPDGGIDWLVWSADVRQTDLELIDSPTLQGGCILASYRVKRG